MKLFAGCLIATLLILQVKSFILEVLPNQMLNFTMLTQSLEISLIGHLHYVDNLCNLEKYFVLPQRFGNIKDFVITPRQQECAVGI